jgi:hypothetical protein
MDVLTEGQRLPGGHDSLAFGVPRPTPGAIYALAIGGGFAVGPREGRTVLFGRDKPEVHVCIDDGSRPAPRPGDVTEPPRTWRLTPAAEQLEDLEPSEGWTARKVEHTVTAVRTRLSKAGVPNLTREEVGEPVGNKLNDNLLRELLLSTTLVPPDLRLLGEP